jgi:hypothetical protein
LFGKSADLVFPLPVPPFMIPSSSIDSIVPFVCISRRLLLLGWPYFFSFCWQIIHACLTMPLFNLCSFSILLVHFIVVILPAFGVDSLHRDLLLVWVPNVTFFATVANLD